MHIRCFKLDWSQYLLAMALLGELAGLDLVLSAGCWRVEDLLMVEQRSTNFAIVG